VPNLLPIAFSSRLAPPQFSPRHFPAVWIHWTTLCALRLAVFARENLDSPEVVLMTKPVRHYPLSTTLPSPPLDFEDALTQVSLCGFAYADMVAVAERPAKHLDALADSGVIVSCGALGRGLAPDQSLDSASVTVRRATLDILKQQVADIARLGATHAYLIPGRDNSSDGLARYGEACQLLADYAGQRMVTLCVEHFPETALPSAGAALEWLEKVDHDNLGLLIDVGHCLISNEDPSAIVAQAGNRLRYVHLDDNDGINDLHAPLLSTGKLTEAMLRKVLSALAHSNYEGKLALELKAPSAETLRLQRELLERLLREARGKDPAE